MPASFSGSTILTCPPVASATFPNSTSLQSVPFIVTIETETPKDKANSETLMLC